MRISTECGQNKHLSQIAVFWFESNHGLLFNALEKLQSSEVTDGEELGIILIKSVTRPERPVN